MTLDNCMACGSGDLEAVFAGNGRVDCAECEARHYPNGGAWLCNANTDGIGAIEAAQATVRDEFS